MQFAVIGRTGQLARALSVRAVQHGHSVMCFDRAACDLSQSPEDIKAFITALPSHIDGVIIAAAYTAVDAAETDKTVAMAVNGIAPGAIAQACAARKIPLVHISTDYVFNGTASTPYKTDQRTDPVNFYGQSKLAGEQAIINNGVHAAILRTSWVFDGTGKNFLTTMLRLAQTRDTLSVVGDQLGRPTYAGHLADSALIAAQALARETSSQTNPITSIYHVSGTGPIISWSDFARSIFIKASGSLEHSVDVRPISTSDYPTPAARPAYSALDVADFERVFDLKLPSWESGIDAALAERN